MFMVSDAFGFEFEFAGGEVEDVMAEGDPFAAEVRVVLVAHGDAFLGADAGGHALQRHESHRIAGQPVAPAVAKCGDVFFCGAVYFTGQCGEDLAAVQQQTAHPRGNSKPQDFTQMSEASQRRP